MSNDAIPTEIIKALLSAPEDRRKAALQILQGEITLGEPGFDSRPLLMKMTAGAAYLGTSRATLWRLIRSGKIIPVEIRPGTFRVRRHDIERFAGVRS